MTATGRIRRDWLALLPLVYGGLLFAPMLLSGFIRDDFTWIGNAIDTHGDPALLLGLPHRDFRPMAGILFRLNLALSGLHPAGYYAVNLILHLANVALVMRLALLLTSGTRRVALIAGALFAGACGNYGDAVSWISGRTGLLADLFVVSSVLAYSAFLASRSWRDYVLAVVLYSLALLSKETAVVLLPLLALTEWATGVPAKDLVRGRALRAYVPFAILLAGYLALEFAIVRRGSPVIGRDYVLSGHGLANLAEYFARIVLPVNATSFIVPLPHALRSVLQPAQTALTVLLPLGLAALLFTPAPRWAKYSVLWMALNLLPVVFLAGRTSTRYLYGPSIGFCLLVAGFLAWWGGRMVSASSTLQRRLPSVVLAGLLVVQTVVVSFAIQRQRLIASREDKSGYPWLVEKRAAAGRPAPR